MRRRLVSTLWILVLASSATLWSACGGDDDIRGVSFRGDVGMVIASNWEVPRDDRTLLARWLDLPASANAQLSCAAPGGGRLLFCANGVCRGVRRDNCNFDLRFRLSAPARVLLSFVDDRDQDGNVSSGEASSFLPQSIVYCPGDVVMVENATPNFSTGLATASISKVVDRCDGAVPATPTPGGPVPTSTPGGPGPVPTSTPGGPVPTPTPGGPVPTPTPGGPVPTMPPYGYGLAMNAAPGPMLAVLAGLAAFGLLIPRRRNEP